MTDTPTVTVYDDKTIRIGSHHADHRCYGRLMPLICEGLPEGTWEVHRPGSVVRIGDEEAIKRAALVIEEMVQPFAPDVGMLTWSRRLAVRTLDAAAGEEQ